MSFDHIKLKYLVNYLQRGDSPNYSDINLGVQVLNQSCVWPSGVDYSKLKFQNPDDIAKISGWLYLNDILINSTGTGTLGRVCFLDLLPDEYKLFADGHVTIIRVNPELLIPKFLFYFLSTRQNEITVECSVGSTNQIELNRSALGEKEIPLPPLNIQMSIADWLDKETEQIDALITSKQKLLALLEEKKRVLISHAVTKGLNPDVKPRDSGVPWLGDIPEHWSVITIRRIINKLDQGWSPQAFSQPAQDNQYGVLKLSAVKKGEFFPEQNKALEEITIDERYTLQKGDLLITRANTPELVGDVCVIPEEYPFLVFPDLVYRLKLKKNLIDMNWCSIVLQSSVGRNQIEAEAKGSSKSMVKLSQNQILSLQISIPPLEEQEAIATYIQKEQEKITALETVTRKSIDLLKERRSAVITAAVTGELEEAYQ